MKIKIPSDIKLKVYKVSEDSQCIVLENNKKNIVWFLAKKENIKISLRELRSSKLVVNKIKKGIKNLKFGFTKMIKLKGVGFKANLNDNILSLRIGKPQAAEYIIPSDVALKIEQNNILAWSLSVSKIRNFFDKILRETPVRKGAIEIIW